MRILYYGYGANNHSWGVVAQNFSRQFKKMGHEVDIFSTNGINHMPSDLLENVIGHHPENDYDPTKITGRIPNKDYDMNFSFTIMRNFSKHLGFSSKNKFGIWCYEWENFFPKGFAKYHENCDLLLPCSNHAKQIFLDAKIPEEKLSILPYGVDSNFYNFKDLGFNKSKVKYLSVMASTDERKNITGLFTAWAKAFDKNSNVMWIIKVPKNEKTKHDFYKVYNYFKLNYKNMAEIKILNEYIENMQDLYYSCDIYYSLSKAESFLIPALESVLAGKPVIASNHGGALDFLNASNSWLVQGKMVATPDHHVYYGEQANNSARWFEPSISDAVIKLKQSKIDFLEKSKQISLTHEEYKNKFSWESLAKQFLGYCK